MKTTRNKRSSIPVGEWEADVKVQKQGRYNGTLRRKVKTVGIARYDISEIIDDVAVALRRGYEVRLTGMNRDVVRFYPCLDANCTEMFVAAQTIGDFRKSISDIGFHASSDGEVVDAKKECREVAERASEYKKNRIAVTPDTMVTCPRCGTKFRVGKQLV